MPARPRFSRSLALVLATLLVTVGSLAGSSVAQAASKTYSVKTAATVSTKLSSTKFASGSASITYALTALPKKGAGVYTSVALRNNSKGSYVAQVRVYPSGTAHLSIKRINKTSKNEKTTTVAGPVRVKTKLAANKRISVSLSVSGSAQVALKAAATVGGKTISVSKKDASKSRLKSAGTAAARFYTSTSTPNVKVKLVSKKVTPKKKAATPKPTATAKPAVPKPTATATPKPTASATPKPTAAPTPAPTPSAVAAKSSSFPSASTTGVPAGVKLKVHEGDIKITKPNTVIDGLEVRGTITVSAEGVVIKNSKIVGGTKPSSLGLVNNFESRASFTIIDSELVAAHPSPVWNGIFGSNFTAERVNVHGVVDPVRVLGSNVTVRDSWLHDNSYWKSDPLRDGTPTHDDSIQIQAGANIVVEGNRIEDAHNAGIQITQDTSRTKLGSITIRGNYLQGGACTVNIAKTPSTFALSVVDNVFGPERMYKTCNVIAPKSNAPKLTGNTWGATGASANVFTPLP